MLVESPLWQCLGEWVCRIIFWSNLNHVDVFFMHDLSDEVIFFLNVLAPFVSYRFFRICYRSTVVTVKCLWYPNFKTLMLFYYKIDKCFYYKIPLLFWKLFSWCFIWYFISSRIKMNINEIYLINECCCYMKNYNNFSVVW